MSDVVELQRAGRVEQRGAMLAATKTTTVKGEDGKDETLIAGVSRVAAGHWLTTRYPELFVPEPPRGKRRTSARPRRQARTRAAAPKRTPAAEWKPLVRLDTRTAPTFTVRLSERAYLGVTDQAFGQRGTVETGGALFGIPAAKDVPLKIRRVGVPGPKARATEGTMYFDVEHIRQEAIELEQRGGLDRWVGSWHTHPGTLAGHPSQTDLRSFAWDCRRLRDMGRSMDNYIGLILTPAWHGVYGRDAYLSWVKPTVHAWRMYAVADDQFIVERAEVVRC